MFSIRRVLLKAFTGLPTLQTFGSPPRINPCLGSLQRFAYSSSASLMRCYMMGVSGPIALQGDQFMDLKENFNREPILRPIPADRLFVTIEPTGPFHMLDPTRRFLLSGGLTAYMTNKAGLCIENPFVKDNVGVHKELGLIDFKKFSNVKDGAMPQSYLYHRFVDFLEESIVDSHGKIALQQLPLDLNSYIDDLKNPLVLEERIMEHPTLFGDNLYADVCIEVYRLLIQEALSHNINVDLILERIGSDHQQALKTCLSHGLLPQFMPRKVWYKNNKHHDIVRPLWRTFYCEVA